MSQRSPVTRGRQLHCPLRGSQVVCKEPSALQWQAVTGEQGVGMRWDMYRHPPPPARTLTGAGGEAVETGAALLAGGARVAGAAVAQTTCPTELVQGSLGITAAGYGSTVGSGPGTIQWPGSFLSQPSTHHGSWGNHGGLGGSGHSEAPRTRAGMGSGQPRHSLQAGSLQGCSHILQSGVCHRVP
jgi:hypothetical protein